MLLLPLWLLWWMEVNFYIESGKILLVRIVENDRVDAFLGQVRLSKYDICPAGLGKI